MKETARSTPSQGKRELTQNAPPARASNTSASTISAVSNAEETEKTTLSRKKGIPTNCLLCEGKGYLIDKKTVIAINYIKINI